jgi:hypothetical protein
MTAGPAQMCPLTANSGQVGNINVVVRRDPATGDATRAPVHRQPVRFNTGRQLRDTRGHKGLPGYPALTLL